MLPITRPRYVEGPENCTADHARRTAIAIWGDRHPQFRPSARPVEICVGSALIDGISHHYAEARGLAALIGSSGYLEECLCVWARRPSTWTPGWRRRQRDGRL
jgi:hypothetical protein